MMGPTLKTTNLVLVSPMVFQGLDMSHHLRWLNDPKVVKYSEQRHEKHTRTTQYQYMSSYTDSPNYIWEIHADGTHIGSITAIRDPYNKTANVGIMIGDTRYWGRGFAVQAYEVVCDFLFSNDTRKIEAGTMGANAGMIRVLGRRSRSFSSQWQTTGPAHLWQNPRSKNRPLQQSKPRTRHKRRMISGKSKPTNTRVLILPQIQISTIASWRLTLYCACLA
jgi:RimJ/RimL family protein N-acetyltransferase